MQSLFPTRQEKQHGFHALQLRHVLSGAAAFRCSIARCSKLLPAVAAAAVVLDAPVFVSDMLALLASFTLSTSTVNFMASVAALVRK
mmetsp:Transcript_10137/g.26802  ORF Transcript_10137/g.26802 Transcript_10137/m.26802 type:complete len:87 (+) Transcript_10137:498-758(+)